MILLTVAMTGLGFMKAHRKPLLLSGLLSAPCSLTTFYFVPEYWRPVRLFDLPIGIEDTLFSFSTGIIAWFLVGIFYNGSTLETGLKPVLKRYCVLGGIGIMVLLVHRQLPVKVMTQAMIGIFVVGASFP
ncbi:MAG: hypothetical protein U5R49_13465 [Deltaproteobacteria bacterium]|nr:hypothetical protein [Deltaproteobacteria bacterium]